MSLVLGLFFAGISVLLLVARWGLGVFAKLGSKMHDKGVEYLNEYADARKRKAAPLSAENWYDKASVICSETVDALLNDKTGTTERMVRSLAAKLAYASAPVGLFSIASIFGTAGTGTAISSLSGAAFNSAALKWLGFGSSMAAGGWVVAIFSVIAAVIMHSIARTFFRKFRGRKRKLNSLDGQERSVVHSLRVIALGFRTQAEQSRPLDATSAQVLYAEALNPLYKEIRKCLEKIDDWPPTPKDRLAQRITEIKELTEFLQFTARLGRNKLGTVTGAKFADVVSVTILKLSSSPIPELNSQEELVVEAIRRTYKRKYRNAPTETLSEFLRLERIDRMEKRLKKIKRIYGKLKKQRAASNSNEEYTLTFVQSQDQTKVEMVTQHNQTGEISHSVIHNTENIEVISGMDAQIHSNTSNSSSSFEDDENEMLENLSIATMITLARLVETSLSGRKISKEMQKKFLEDAAIMASTTSLSRLVLEFT